MGKRDFGGRRRSSANPPRGREREMGCLELKQRMKLPGGEKGFLKTGEREMEKQERRWQMPLVLERCSWLPPCILGWRGREAGFLRAWYKHGWDQTT